MGQSRRVLRESELIGEGRDARYPQGPSHSSSAIRQGDDVGVTAYPNGCTSEAYFLYVDVPIDAGHLDLLLSLNIQSSIKCRH